MQTFLFESRPDLPALLDRVARADGAYLKFLSANDLGLTGAHQAGVYLTRDSWPLFFDRPGVAGENTERALRLVFDDGYETEARAVWYGTGSRAEYRLTRVGYFRNRSEAFLGALFVLSRVGADFFASVLTGEADIDTLLNFFGISPAETGRLLRFELEERLRPYVDEFLKETGPGFPDTLTFARAAQSIFARIFGTTLAADAALLELFHIEYALFRVVEKLRYEYLLVRPFESLDHLLAVSLEISNRRKSRAGLSFENHLRFLFEQHGLRFSHGEVTENKKRPDFIFPGVEAYHSPGYDPRRLFLLGAKTTCKDRWRQILDEADRIPRKHLVTLERSLTASQISQMRAADVQLVVPERYHASFRAEDREFLMTLQEFIDMVAHSANTGGGEASLFAAV